MVRLVIWNWHFWFRPVYIPLTVIVGMVIGLSSGQFAFALSSTPNSSLGYWDGVLLGLLGPSEIAVPVELLRWLMVPIMLLALTNTIASADIERFGYTTASRAGSRRSWFTAKVLLLPLMSLYYVITILLGILIGVRVYLPFDTASDALLNSLNVTSINTYSAIFWWIIFTTTSLILFSLLQLVLSVFVPKSFYAFVAVILLVLVSVFISYNNPLAIWLPGTQAILRAHYPINMVLPEFSFGWSLAYNLFSCFIIYVISLPFIRRISFP
jgi:hypothetical protein